MKRSILVCVIFAGCSFDKPPAPVARGPATLVLTATRANTPSACPHTGKWALCNVEQRLRQSGFVAKRVTGQPPNRAGFSVTPAVYTLGQSRLELFIYDDETALARDMAKMDTITVSPKGVATAWEGTPLLIRAGNLAAVLIGDNPRQADRLALALTAGAPQPGSPR